MRDSDTKDGIGYLTNETHNSYIGLIDGNSIEFLD